MPNSLKTRITKLRHKGSITFDECEELLNKLNGHDRELTNQILDNVLRLIKCRLTDNLQLENATKYGNETPEQADISYGTLMRYEIAYCVEDLIDDIWRMKNNNEKELC